MSRRYCCAETGLVTCMSASPTGGQVGRRGGCMLARSRVRPHQPPPSNAAPLPHPSNAALTGATWAAAAWTLLACSVAWHRSITAGPSPSSPSPQQWSAQVRHHWQHCPWERGAAPGGLQAGGHGSAAVLLHRSCCGPCHACTACAARKPGMPASALPLSLVHPRCPTPPTMRRPQQQFVRVEEPVERLFRPGSPCTRLHPPPVACGTHRGAAGAGSVGHFTS